MYNTNQYNTDQYNSQAQLFNDVQAQDDIVFNGFSLQSSTVITVESTWDDPPKRDLKTFKVPRDDGEGVISDFYRRKIIRMQGIIKGTSKEDLNNNIDEFKKETSALEGNLDIKINDETRRFKATMTLQKVFKRKNFHVTFVPFVIEFAVLTPFGQSIEFLFDELLAESQLNLTRQIENLGTATAKPLFTIFMPTVNSITEISIENTTTSEKIIITKAYANNDVLQVDSEEKIVKINGSIVDYLGVFPSLGINTNSFNLVLTGTSIVYNLTTKYLKTYL